MVTRSTVTAGVGAILLLATSCSGGSSVQASSTVTTAQPVCDAPTGVATDDPFSIARDLVDATQSWDLAAICSLIGRDVVPHGVIDYHAALEGGLSRDIELVGKRVTAADALFDFDVPAAGGSRFGLAFQLQDGRWVLVTSVFVEK